MNGVRAGHAVMCALLLAGCREAAPEALGTLEYDRVTLPAPVSERIGSIDVREGQQVAAGTRLLTLERVRNQAQAAAAQAEAQRQAEMMSAAFGVHFCQQHRSRRCGHVGPGA